MDPEKFATLAEEIAKGASPAHCRTAIGRAYYSTFLTAFLLLQKDIRFAKSGDKHTKVRHYLASSGNPLLEDVARELNDLRILRTRADYEMTDSGVELPAVATDRVRLSKRLNADLRSVLNGPERAKIIAAIGEYRRKINDF